MNFRLWQMWLWPATQAGQCPHGSSGRTVTRSPALQPSTPLPTSGDGARHFVPHHVRQRHAVSHGAVKQVEVGAADAAEGNADLHLPGARLHGYAVAHTECPIAFEEYGLHECPLLFYETGAQRQIEDGADGNHRAVGKPQRLLVLDVELFVLR